MDTSSFALTSDGGTGPTDLILVQRAASGDKAAVEEVLVRLSCVVRFVYRLNKTLGCNLPSDALEDVVQQVYIGVWPRLAEFQGASALESWVYGFCRNCLRSELRRKRMQSRVATVADDDLDQQPHTNAAPRIGEQLVRDEGIFALREELEKLKPVEREAVVLRHLEGWSFETIAERQGLSASTVKDRCYRAMMKMKGRLKSRDVSA